MPGYPNPDGYGTSSKDGNMVRTGTGGRLSLDPFDHDGDYKTDWRTDYRRNESDEKTLPGTDPTD